MKYTYQVICKDCSYKSLIFTDFQEALSLRNDHYDNSIFAYNANNFEIEKANCPNVQLTEIIRDEVIIH